MIRLSVTVGCLLLATSSAHAADYQLQPLTIQGATGITANTINGNGIVAGTYVTANGSFGFLGKPGAIVALPPITLNGVAGYPNPSAVTLAGDLVGIVTLGPEPYVFLRRHGKYQPLIDVGTCNRYIQVPSVADNDTIAYDACTQGDPDPYVLVYGGQPQSIFGLTYTTVASVTKTATVAGVVPTLVNGRVEQSVYFGNVDAVMQVLPPGATSSYGGYVNDAGQVAGWYVDAKNASHGFIYKGGSFTQIDPPPDPNASIAVQGLDQAGRVVGVYYGQDALHGFVYEAGVLSNFGSFGGSDTVHVAISGVGGRIVVSDSPSGSGAAVSFIAVKRGKL